MFSRILFSTIAAASLASARPALAEDAAAGRGELHASSTSTVACRDEHPAAMETRRDDPAVAERQRASRGEDVERSFFGPSGSGLNTFGGA
jgi:hypothetical protein